MAVVTSTWYASAVIVWILILWHHANAFLLINLNGGIRKLTQPIMSSAISWQFVNEGERSPKKLRSRRVFTSKTQEITSMASSLSSHRIDFVSPLLDYGYPAAAKDLERRQKNETGDNEKPILLYLPGFDGTYICPFVQFPELGTEFEVWCMTIGMEDRSTYEQLKTVVLDFLKSGLTMVDRRNSNFTYPVFEDTQSRGENSIKDMSQERDLPSNGNGLFAGIFSGNTKRMEGKNNGRPLYIAGESFGGILASDVALTLLTEQMKRDDVDKTNVNLQGLVLINPATCYDRSQLATAGPPVAKSPFPFYALGLFSKLVPLFTDEFSLEQLFLILQAKALPSVIDNPSREAYMGRVALSLPTKLEFMPPATLSWRLNEWLRTGCAALRNSSFAAFPNFRSLIIVGEKDKTLPSLAEAERLANKVMNPSKTKIHVVEGAGHASTCGSRLDLAAVIRDSFTEFQKTPELTRWRKAKRSPKSSIELDAASSRAYASTDAKRTNMKPQARQGVGPYFGMEERYDNADVGLNPLLYWSKSNFVSVERTQEEKILDRRSQDPLQYKKAVYKVPM